MAKKEKNCISCAGETEEPAVHRLQGADGEAVVTAYPVFPGISILYYDIHAHECELEKDSARTVMCISHCREGRLEQQMRGEHYFLAPGDLAVSRTGLSDGAARFPTGHYHGITVTIDPARAPDCLSCFLSDVNVRPAALMEKFCADEGYFAARSSARVEHIFSELYSVPEEIRKGYFKVKILELLLFLSALPTERRRAAYSGSQVQLAAEVSRYLLEATGERPTMADLAAKFHASATQILQSFQGVYGMSPSAFLRAQKMHAAAEQLRSTDRTVLDIAGQFGYDNASKFARTFRSIIGVSPNAYRAGLDVDSCAPCVK
jgi:AraC-like DNA-binding protein